MAEQKVENNQWLSTYGLVTVERILGHFQIVLHQSDLINALQNSESFFYRLVQLPLENVLNGLIRQQAYDLQVYAQKLFVDYLLSGETVKPESSPGGLTREELEDTRLFLVAESKEFHELEYEHNKQISSSQRAIVQSLKPWRQAIKEVETKMSLSIKKRNISINKRDVHRYLFSVLANFSLSDIDTQSEKISIFLQSINDKKEMTVIAEEMMTILPAVKIAAQALVEKTFAFETEARQVGQQFRKFRKVFQDVIIKSNDLLRSLPDYVLDKEQDSINRELIIMDTMVTEENIAETTKNATEES